jgi:L-alanine-DL-glutamate epimerase-like enolase superfamily enzyme
MREEAPMNVKGLEILRCDAGWRNYHFLKLTTDEGIVGLSEFDEGFGSPGVSAVIERLAGRVAGQPVFDHERIYTELYCFTRPAAGGVVAEGLGAIENALLDAKAKALGVPRHALLGGKLRDRIRVYWSHCATWRINHPTLYKPANHQPGRRKGDRRRGAREGLRRAEDEHLHLQWGRSARLAARVWRSVHA